MSRDRYKFKVTCRCGAELETERWLASEADLSVKEFNDAHKSCREQSVFDQVFGDDPITRRTKDPS